MTTPRNPVVLLIGTLDTKGEEYAFLRERLIAADVETVLVDAGIGEPVGAEADISAVEVARAAGEDLGQLQLAQERGRAVTAMAAGAREIARRFYEEGRCDGVIGIGGSGGTTIATSAMRALPLGVPKLVVSTVATLDTQLYVGSSDITMMASVVDIAGLNSITTLILANVAAAMAGMLRQPLPANAKGARTSVAATMFGVTTGCVTAARRELERLGHEVIVFHATGSGGRAMETLIEQGHFDAVLDVTTTELADEVAGGNLSAGPDRLGAAGRRGIPQVVSLGALDMINFGAVATLPEKMRTRLRHEHNASVTLVRTTEQECADIGRLIGEKLSAAQGPVAVFVPLRGVSQLSEQHGPFFDAAADKALIDALKGHLSEQVEYHELDLPINHPDFAIAMAQRMDRYLMTEPVVDR